MSGSHASDHAIGRLYDMLADIVNDKAQAWRQDAACRGMGPDVFFTGRGDNAAIREATAVCDRCPVSRECGEYASEVVVPFGVWGGMGASRLKRERGRVRRERHGTPV